MVGGQLCGFVGRWTGCLRPWLTPERAARGLAPALVDLPFATQLRHRLVQLGPTYIKLGQIMAVCEDMLPRRFTDELKNLYDRAPVAPFPAIRTLIETELRRPLTALFARIEEQPLGSASPAQVHRAITHDGRDVVVKVHKPGVRRLALADLALLRGLGGILSRLVPHYQPAAIIEEFCAYNVRALDLTVEADDGETFAAHFHDSPAIVFPRMYREPSSASVLTVRYPDGFKPGDPDDLHLGRGPARTGGQAERDLKIKANFIPLWFLCRFVCRKFVDPARPAGARRFRGSGDGGTL